MIVRVLKFKVKQGENTITMIEGSKIVDFNSQGPDLYIWAEVPTMGAEISKTVRFFGTGFSVDTTKWSFVKTHHHAGFVWHLYEAK